MRKVGLTGGIGSGKSVVAKIFNCLHIPVYESDEQAKILMNSNEIIREAIILLLGSSAYNGTVLQKQVVSQAIFSDSSLRMSINSIVHPEIRNHFNEWANKQTSSYVIMESALLFDSDLYTYFDKVICVNAHIETRIQRVMQRNNVTRDDVLQRMKMQPENEFCLRKSDFVVENNNTFVIPQVIAIHNCLIQE